MKKYSNGKVKRTLKKGLKVLEMVKRERNKIILIERISILIFFSFKFKKKTKIVFLLKKKFEMTYYHCGTRWKKEVIN